MAGRKSLKTILSIPISFDDKDSKKVIDNIRKDVGKLAKEMRAELSGALSSQDIVKSATVISGAFAEVSASFATSTADIEKQVNEISELFAGQTGQNVEQFRELFQKAIDTKSLDYAVKSLQSLQKATGLSVDEIARVTKGWQGSEKAVAAYLDKAKKVGDESFKADYQRLSKVAGVATTPEAEAKFIDRAKTEEAIQALRQLGEVADRSEKELFDLAKTMASPTVAFKEFGLTVSKTGDLVDSSLVKIQDKFRELAKSAKVSPTIEGLQAYQKNIDLSQQIQALQQLSKTSVLASEDLKRLAQLQLQELAPSAKMTAIKTDELATKFQRLSATAKQANEIKSLASSLELNTSSAKRLARELGYSEEAIKKYVKSQAQMQEGRGIGGILTPYSMTSGIQAGAAAVGVSFGVYGAVELGKSAYQASLKLENLDLAFQSVYGSSAQAGAMLSFVREESERLGLNFLATADSAKKLFAAAKGTSLEQDAQLIFRSFSTMGTALKLSNDEMNSVFLAISQIISKGKVSAEELRLQLAERMPGAVTLFAKAIGVSNKELDKMLQAGQVGLEDLRKFAILVGKTYEQGAIGASKGLQAELNRLSNSWMDLKTAFVSTEGTADLVRGFNELAKTITNNASAITTFVKSLLLIGTGVVGLFAISKAFTAVTLGAASLINFFGNLGNIFSKSIASAVATAATYRVALAGMTSSTANFAAGLQLLSKGPVAAIAAGVAVLGIAIYAYTTRMTEGEKIVLKYSKSLDELAISSKNVAAAQVNLGQEALEKTAENIRKQQQALEKNINLSLGGGIQSIVQEAISSLSNIPTEQVSSPVLLRMGFTFTDTEISGRKAAVDFQKGALDVLEAFKKNYKVEFGVDSEQNEKIVQETIVQLKSLEEAAKAQGVEPEAITKITKAIYGLLGQFSNLDIVKAQLKDLLSSASAVTGIDFTKANEAFDSIKKSIEKTDAGKLVKSNEAAEAYIKSLQQLGVTAKESQNYLTFEHYDENVTATKAAIRAVDNYNIALSALPEFAAKSKISLSDWTEIIRLAGENSKLTTSEVQALQEAVKKGFEIEGAKGLQEVIDKTRISLAKLKADAQTKAALSTVVDAIAGEDTVNKIETAKKAIKAMDFSDLDLKVGTTSEKLREAVLVLQEFDKTQSSIKAAPKAESQLKKISEAVADSKKQIVDWKAKIDESKADVFVSSLDEKLRKLDETILNSKGFPKQIGELTQIREELAKTGKDYEDYIEKTQKETLAKEYRKDIKSFNTRYEKLSLGDKAGLVENANEQYEMDIAMFASYLEKKKLTLDEYNEKIRQAEEIAADARLRASSDFYDQLLVASNDYFNKYRDVSKMSAEIITGAVGELSNAVGDLAVSGARDFNSFGEAAAKMADSFITSVARMFANQAAAALLSGITGWAAGMFGNSVAGPETSNISSAWFDKFQSSGSSFLASAKGNAFTGLSGFSNSVVTQPTSFSYGTHVTAFARGAGLMGEAGPEAVMPLIRTASGHLGVRGGAQGQAPVINQVTNFKIINNTDVDVEKKESRDSQGNMDFEIILSRRNARAMSTVGSPENRALQNIYGAKTQIASR